MQEHELARALIDRLSISSDAKRRMLGLYVVITNVKKRQAKEQEQAYDHLHE